MLELGITQQQQPLVQMQILNLKVTIRPMFSFQKIWKLNLSQNNNLRTNIGIRLNMAVVTIQADYTFSKYPTATLGLG